MQFPARAARPDGVLFTREAAAAISKSAITLLDRATGIAHNAERLAAELEGARIITAEHRRRARALADATEWLRGTAVLLDDWVKGKARG